MRKHNVIKLCSIEYLTTQIQLVLPTFKSGTVHKIIEYLTAGLYSLAFEISIAVQKLPVFDPSCMRVTLLSVIRQRHIRPCTSSTPKKSDLPCAPTLYMIRPSCSLVVIWNCSEVVVVVVDDPRCRQTSLSSSTASCNENLVSKAGVKVNGV